MADEIKLNFDADSAEGRRLKAIFGGDDAAVTARAQMLAKAAREEYRLWFTGERNPGTAREQRELRLKLLYEHLPDGEPTDVQLQKLFQLTPAAVATLIANTRARYGDQLGERSRRAAIDALTNRADKVDDDTVRVVLDPSLGRYVKELVDETEAPPLEKSKTASRTYDIGRDTIIGLCEKLDIDPGDVDVIDWP